MSKLNGRVDSGVAVGHKHVGMSFTHFPGLSCSLSAVIIWLWTLSFKLYSGKRSSDYAKLTLRPGCSFTSSLLLIELVRWRIADGGQ